jgi:hypothetical protein
VPFVDVTDAPKGTAPNAGEKSYGFLKQVALVALFQGTHEDAASSLRQP